MHKPVLCSESECTGCEACKNSCPEACITMQSNEKGFLHPVIDYGRCGGCKLCEKSCPVLNKPVLNRSVQPKVYACWHKNDEVRMRSSSGGVFSALAEMVLDQGGVVFGAAYGENLHVHHIGIEKAEDLDKLRRSKYVQSEIGDTIKQVKQYLENGRQVLFVGTPCQVVGLYAFLGEEYDNLLTADLICGGVPSPKVFNRYVESIEKHYKTKLSDINFRNKRHGWENNTVIGISSKDEYHLRGARNSFFYGYRLHIFLRHSCYQCPAQGLPRPGDITIADFWGIKKDSHISQNKIDKGISLLMINKITSISEIVSSIKKWVVLYEREFNEAGAGNKVMFIPPIKPSSREDFFNEFKLLSYETIAKKYLKYPLKRRMVQFVKESLGAGILSRLRSLKEITKV